MIDYEQVIAWVKQDSVNRKLTLECGLSNAHVTVYVGTWEFDREYVGKFLDSSEGITGQLLATLDEKERAKFDKLREKYGEVANA